MLMKFLDDIKLSGAFNTPENENVKKKSVCYAVGQNKLC